MLEILVITKLQTLSQSLHNLLAWWPMARIVYGASSSTTFSDILDRILFTME